MGFLTKIDNGIQAFKHAFGAETVPPLYSQLTSGDHTYNYETTRFGLFSALGFGNAYYTPRENLKWYYENVGFLADCINLYADIASQVQIQEVDAAGNVVENSEWVNLLDQPNAWQDGIAFIKEFVINTLTTGINISYGNFFRNGNLRINADLYNIDFYNLAFPKVKDRYAMRRREIEDLTFKEYLDENKTRTLKMYELAIIYDQIAKNTYSEKGYDADKFLSPLSRLHGIQKDLHTLMNSSDNMTFLSHRRANFIISRKSDASGLAPLPTQEKDDIEKKLSGFRKNDVVATSEDLQTLNLQRKVKDFHLIEMQNNAKENIRSRFGIPRDLLDAYTGTNSGSTYENQQFAEARFVLNNVKNITDSFLYAIEKKNPAAFSQKGHKLIGRYDHMASIQAVNAKLKNEGFSAKATALMAFLNAYEKSQSLGIDLNYNEFLKNYGFEEFLKTQTTQ